MRRVALWKGFAAGLAGGFAASWAMGQTYGLILSLLGRESVEQQSEDPTIKVACVMSRLVLRRDLTRAEKKTAGPLVHYTFGASVAAAYGVIAEHAPSVTLGEGVPFGAALWMAAHVIAVPVLSLAPTITDSDPAAESTEFLSHLLYGAVTELIRSRLRSQLG